MPKMKSHRGAAKRFRLSGTGKVMRRKATGNHMLTKKTPGQRRRISGMAVVGPEAGRIRQLLGGGAAKRRSAADQPVAEDA
jgi:large subunit ribosomal protein L35